MFAAHIAASFIGGPSPVVLWAMYADAADYSEWRNHRRATGLVFSAATFSQKMGCAVGAAMTGFALDFYRYAQPIEGVDQAAKRNHADGPADDDELDPGGVLCGRGGLSGVLSNQRKIPASNRIGFDRETQATTKNLWIRQLELVSESATEPTQMTDDSRGVR